MRHTDLRVTSVSGRLWTKRTPRFAGEPQLSGCEISARRLRRVLPELNHRYSTIDDAFAEMISQAGNFGVDFTIDVCGRELAGLTEQFGQSAQSATRQPRIVQQHQPPLNQIAQPTD